MPECKFDFQIICPTRNPNNEFRKLTEKKVFERKQEKQKEKDQETQANEIADMVKVFICVPFIKSFKLCTSSVYELSIRVLKV